MSNGCRTICASPRGSLVLGRGGRTRCCGGRVGRDRGRGLDWSVLACRRDHCNGGRPRESRHGLCRARRPCTDISSGNATRPACGSHGGVARSACLGSRGGRLWYGVVRAVLSRHWWRVRLTAVGRLVRAIRRCPAGKLVPNEAIQGQEAPSACRRRPERNREMTLNESMELTPSCPARHSGARLSRPLPMQGPAGAIPFPTRC